MATSSEASDQNNVKSRRPAESAFKQQRLPAWQPILTAGTVLPTFFVIGIAFIPVGIGLLYFSDEVKERVVDYTFCQKKESNITCADDIKQKIASQDPCQCEMTINLTEDFKGEVYFYYGLSNYYQNHRRYVKSRDDNQLLGRLDQPLSTDCDPFAYANESGSLKPIAPCGAIANSLFNDSLSLVSADWGLVPVFRTGIAWDSDKNIKFRNPKGVLKTAFENFTKPSNWAKHIWELDNEIPENNGFQNEDLIVWMRTAALPTFRKLYRRVNHSKDGFRRGLNKGLYTLIIDYNYPVTDFDGTKSFIISTTSLLGGKNPFLGVAYVVVGTLCLLLGIVLLIIHVKCSKRYYPSPSESFFMDLDTRAGAVDRRLETLRAINLAYNRSDTEQSEMNIARTDKITSIMDAPKDTAKPETKDTAKPDAKETAKPDATPTKIEPKPTNSATRLEAKPSQKRLYSDSGNYSPEEKLKLQRAAEDLSTTERGWEDFANTYSRALYGHDLKEPEEHLSKVLPNNENQANKSINIKEDAPNKGGEPNKETGPKKGDEPEKDEPKKD